MLMCDGSEQWRDSSGSCINLAFDQKREKKSKAHSNGTSLEHCCTLVSAQPLVRTDLHGVSVSVTYGGISSPISVRDSIR
jgi:hypothetical protein